MKKNLKNIIVLSVVGISFCIANLGYSVQSRDKQRHTKGAAVSTAECDLATCLRQTKGCANLPKDRKNVQRIKCFEACKKATKLKK